MIYIYFLMKKLQCCWELLSNVIGNLLEIATIMWKMIVMDLKLHKTWQVMVNDSSNIYLIPGKSFQYCFSLITKEWESCIQKNPFTEGKIFKNFRPSISQVAFPLQKTWWRNCLFMGRAFKNIFFVKSLG